MARLDSCGLWVSLFFSDRDADDFRWPCALFFLPVQTIESSEVGGQDHGTSGPRADTARNFDRWCKFTEFTIKKSSLYPLLCKRFHRFLWCITRSITIRFVEKKITKKNVWRPFEKIWAIFKCLNFQKQTFWNLIKNFCMVIETYLY